MIRGKLHRDFGHRIRRLRNQRGFTQEQLAEKAGVHVTYLGGIERGTRNPSLTSIGRLARGLGTTLTILFDGL